MSTLIPLESCGQPSTLSTLPRKKVKSVPSISGWASFLGLSLEVAKTAAVGCKKILAAAQFSNIEIAFRESVFTRSAGPQLIDHVPVGFEDHTADIRGPFTGSLGVQIARLDTPYFEGTGALYICEGDRVFLLTARHVALPPKLHKNDLYHYKCDSQPRHDVLILGYNAYQDAVRDIMAKIGHELYYVTLYERRLAAMGEAVDGEDARAADGRQALKGKLAMAEETIVAVKEFHDDITEHWNTESCRILGHVFYAPPISVGTSPKEFTEDWALIELNRNMIDWDIFKGNVVYLGNKISSNDFNIKMRSEGHSFEYPLDGLLQVKGIIEEEEIFKNREKCLLVIKNGKGTGVTIGRESGIESFTRVYGDHGIKSTSREIAIYSYSRKESPFSDEGDSGSIVVDGLGRIVGMITGGAGLKNALDVTYTTPYFWLEKQIKKAFPDSYLWQ